MCGRYAFAVNDLGRWRSTLVGSTVRFDHKYNISPTSAVPVFTSEGWQLMRWGLIPAWSKDPIIKYATFNARSESLIDKPAYRSAWKHGQRCLIPATGYFEWKQVDEKKIPYFIKSALPEPLVFAGLWDSWTNADSEILSCSIITREADGELKELHSRMPVMLHPDTGRNWLHGIVEDAQSMLHATHDMEFEFYPVDPKIGNPRNQGSELIRPLHGHEF